jgi:hypothetical protein
VDFLIAACPAPVTADGTVLRQWDDQLEAELRRRAALLHREELEEVCFWLGFEVTPKRFYQRKSLDRALKGEIIDSLNQRAHQLIDMLAVGLTADFACGRFLECSCGRRDGCLWILNGGGTAGDSPTAFFDAITALGHSSIFEEPLPQDETRGSVAAVPAIEPASESWITDETEVIMRQVALTWLDNDYVDFSFAQVFETVLALESLGEKLERDLALRLLAANPWRGPLDELVALCRSTMVG